MAKKKNLDDADDLKSHGEEKKDSQEELDDILGKLKESDRKVYQEKPKDLVEKQSIPERKSKPAEGAEPEGLDQILQSITEKPEEKPAEELNFLQRVIGIFTNPERVFQYLRVKPDYILPLLLAVILTTVSSPFIYDIAINDQIANIEKNDSIPDDRKELIIDQISASQEGSRKIIYMLVVPPISVLILYALISGIFLFIGNIILGGKARFVQLLSIYSYSYLIVMLLGMIIKIPLILARQTTQINLSPAVFFSPEQVGQAIFNFIQSFDIFNIWFIVVFGIGFAVIYAFSKPKGIISVIIAWLLYVLIFKVWLAIAFQGLMS
ncbi:MAG: hypothetical protein A2Y94_15530 [Caldithrix sp. RBG_13_44_9]|nr:MAG: hypothetical protein A2Y94_15530 [Caldithrix sp. RBG_13_44_9]